MKTNRHKRLLSYAGSESQAIWVIAYSDMMTALMVFFLILWAYSALAGSKPRPTKAAEAVVSEQIRQDLEAVGAVAVSGRKMTVTLPSAVLFDPGSADLTENAKASLSKVASAMSRSTAPIVVEGHTDDVPIQFSRWRSNYELSAARAFSVIQYLTGNLGIPPERLAARGYGPFRSVVSNDVEENRAKNRRIEIHLLVQS
jgi:chemotaxis protein MotB